MREVRKVEAMSFYVQRKHPEGRVGWVGPIRSEKQAGKEVAAWESVGWEAECHPSTPAIRATVRRWVKTPRDSR